MTLNAKIYYPKKRKYTHTCHSNIWSNPSNQEALGYYGLKKLAIQILCAVNLGIKKRKCTMVTSHLWNSNPDRFVSTRYTWDTHIYAQQVCIGSISKRWSDVVWVGRERHLPHRVPKSSYVVRTADKSWMDDPECQLLKRLLSKTSNLCLLLPKRGPTV